MTRISAPQPGPLGDAARVLAATASLAPLLERLADAPLDPAAVAGLRSWLEEAYPPAAAALDRLQASGATATPRGPRRPRLALVGHVTA